MSEERFRLGEEKAEGKQAMETKGVLFGCKMKRLSTYQERGGVMPLHNCPGGGRNRVQPHWLVAVTGVWRSHAGTFQLAVALPASTGRQDTLAMRSRQLGKDPFIFHA